MNINDSCCSYRSLWHAFSLGSSITTLLLLVHIGTKTYYNKKRECLVAPFDSDKPSFYLMGSRPPSSKKVVEPFISLTASFIWEILRRIKWKSICTKNIIIMIAQQFLGHGGMDTNTLSRNFLLKRPRFQDWKRLWSFCHFWEKWFENSFWQDSITSLNASYVCRLKQGENLENVKAINLCTADDYYCAKLWSLKHFNFMNLPETAEQFVIWHGSNFKVL